MGLKVTVSAERTERVDRICLSSERATANIHQEKNANIQGFAFHQNNFFFELEKEHPEIPFIHLDSSSEHKSN